MSKKVKSTLSELTLIPGRKVGNTTREVDNAIDMLYEGYIIEARDHYALGGDRKANEMLLERILKRLLFEHQVDLNRVKVDTNKLTVELD